MDARHMLTHHLLIPAGVVGALLLVGAPLNVAFVVGMMVGCLSMAFPMRGGSHRADDQRNVDGAAHRDQARSPGRLGR